MQFKQGHFLWTNYLISEGHDKDAVVVCVAVFWVGFLLVCFLLTIPIVQSETELLDSFLQIQ